MKQLPPAYFALVMATGIVSIAAHDIGLIALANALFGLNVAAFIVLVVLTGLRFALYPRLLLADLTDHLVGPGFFTIVAACCILGTQLLLMAHDLSGAVAMLALGIVLWIGLTYTIFTAFTVKRRKPRLEEALTGAWLIGVVATQSIAVLAALIARDWVQPYRLELNFFALSMWLWGGMFYIWIISLIFYRYNFFAFSPSDLSPPYWINMGAMAISALAGARLIENVPAAPFLASLSSFLKGFTVFYWATGTWWIPMLLVLGVWRHGIERFPLRYDPLYWGAVFPLGMYTVATREMASALDLPFLLPLLTVAFAVALGAWGLTFFGLVSELAGRLFPRRG